MKKEQIILQVSESHRRLYGNWPEAIAWAPGRIEVLGNHTDYNAGTVLSAAIDKGHCFCISRSNRPGIHLFAADANQKADFDVNEHGKVPGIGSGNYVKGVFYLIKERLKRPIDKLDCTSFGVVPLGAGLSSSAALEVSAALALMNLLGVKIDRKELGALCRDAEHQFAGTHCGLLDQFSSLFGEEHALIHSDFQCLEISTVNLPENILFLIVNPHVKHSLSESPYNERRQRCEQAAAELAKYLPHPVETLRDVSSDEFKAYQSKIDPAAAKRATHVIGEMDRVARGKADLEAGRIEEFGQLLFESHQSSIDYFENSCPELDIVVNAARDASAYGARLSGGGFGGSAIILVDAAHADQISEQIQRACVNQDFSPDIIMGLPSRGAHTVRSEK